MRRWLLVALLAVPVVDVLLLVYLASAIGGVQTVALVVLTALVGLLLVRAEGRHTLARLQRELAAGEVPTDAVLDGALLLAAGVFLLTPGLVTDLVGLLLVLPPTRYPIRVALSRWVVVPVADDYTGGFVSGNVYTFEFPGDSGVGNVGGGGPWDAAGGGTGGPFGAGEPRDAVDLGPDAYHVDVEGPEGDGEGRDDGDEEPPDGGRGGS